MRKNIIPNNAKLAFNGVIFEVWQWEQKMFDGTYETFERIRRSGAVQILPVIKDKILVQIQKQPDSPAPYHSFVSGTCEENEEPLFTAKRELEEETGLISDKWILWKKINIISKIDWPVYIFIAKNCHFKKNPELDNGEKIENIFIDFSSLLGFIEHPSFYDKEILAIFFKAILDEKERKKFHELLFTKE